MRKIFVLDTSVLAYHSSAFESFNNNDVVIPIVVLEELDKLKKFSNESGKNARISSRLLDELSNQGKIHEGIKISNDIIVKIDVASYQAIGHDPNYGDSKILACALHLRDIHNDRVVILVSKDINLRIRARAFGLQAEDYEKDRIKSNDLYSGVEIIQNGEAAEDLQLNGSIDPLKYEIELLPNQFVLFRDEEDNNLTSGRMVDGEIRHVSSKKPWKLSLINKEQLYAADLLLDTSVPLVSLVGTSGGGKTLVSIACALEMMIEKKSYERLIIYRPIQPVGSDIGYLPGDLNEKLDPWMTPIKDSLDFLLPGKGKNWYDKLGPYADQVQMEAITYIRGRSIPNAIMLIDEAQNLSKEEIKTILTRAGNNTKIILTGDIQQIDNSYLDATNNGLTYVVEKFKTSKLAGHITLTKGERSPLATLASEIL